MKRLLKRWHMRRMARRRLKEGDYLRAWYYALFSGDERLQTEAWRLYNEQLEALRARDRRPTNW